MRRVLVIFLYRIDSIVSFFFYIRWDKLDEFYLGKVYLKFVN